MFQYLISIFPYRWHNQQIGGGLALGAAALAGGLFAYKKHEEHKEQVISSVIKNSMYSILLIFLYF